MIRIRHAWIAVAMTAGTVTPAAAEVLDAVYRGTLVCDRLPSTRTTLREAIEVKIPGGVVQYNHVVRLRDRPSEMLEKGVGLVKGQDIELQGSWKDDTRQYEAKYSGSFVRRSAQLKGTQTWNEGGKTVTRTCTGAIKRPLKPFLPRSKPAAT